MIKLLFTSYCLTQVPYKQCLWFGKDGEEDVCMVVQVDDMLVNSNENWYKKFVEYLQEKGFEIKGMGLA